MLVGSKAAKAAVVCVLAVEWLVTFPGNELRRWRERGALVGKGAR